MDADHAALAREFLGDLVGVGVHLDFLQLLLGGVVRGIVWVNFVLQDVLTDAHPSRHGRDAAWITVHHAIDDVLDAHVVFTGKTTFLFSRN